MNRNTVGETKVFKRSSAGVAHDSGSMGIVDIQGCLIAFGEICQGRQGGEISIHTKHTFRDDERWAMWRSSFQEGFNLCGVPVMKDPQIGVAQSTAIDHAGMAKAVGQNQPALVDEAWNGTEIGQIPRSKEEGRLRSLKVCQRVLETSVGRKCSADQA